MPRSVAAGTTKARSPTRSDRPCQLAPLSRVCLHQVPLSWGDARLLAAGPSRRSVPTETPGFASPSRDGFAFFRPSPAVTRLVTCGDVTVLRHGVPPGSEVLPPGVLSAARPRWRLWGQRAPQPPLRRAYLATYWSSGVRAIISPMRSSGRSSALTEVDTRLPHVEPMSGRRDTLAEPGLDLRVAVHVVQVERHVVLLVAERGVAERPPVVRLRQSARSGTYHADHAELHPLLVARGEVLADHLADLADGLAPIRGKLGDVLLEAARCVPSGTLRRSCATR